MAAATPPHVSLSYRPLFCCHALQHCDHASLATAAEPCWGEVGMDGWDDGEGTVPMHTCRGHTWVMCMHSEYEPEPLPVVNGSVADPPPAL